MVTDKFINLIRTVEQKSKSGEVPWEETLEDSIFQATLGNFVIRIAEEPGERGPDYRFSVLDGQSHLIDTASNNEFGNAELPSGFQPYLVLREMFETARRKARRADAAIDLILSDLEGRRFILLEAKYGASGQFRDVTKILNEKIVDGRLEVIANNDNLGGDPIPYTPKILSVTYLSSGNKCEKTIPENEKLTLP